MSEESKHFCMEKSQKRFNALRSIFIIFLIASGVGIGFFLYYLIGTEVSDMEGIAFYEIDGTNPPYLGIIMVCVFILSWIGYFHIDRLQREVCF